MANTLKHKQSSVAGKVPTTTDLALGELAINTTDGKVYLKKNVSGTESVVEVAPVTSVAGKTGAVTLAKGDVGLSNVDNTADASKPISTATQTALDTKQPLDADLTAIAALSGTTGLLKKTAANTWALDTASYLTGNQSISFSGDATGSGTTSVALTLANSGATAGTYQSVTVDAKGRVTGGSNPTTLSGYGITDAQPLDADLTSIAGLAGTSGLLKKTAANTWALDTSTYLTTAVTSVSGTAPIVSSGGNTPAISISAATTLAAGSMSAADKSKLDGIASGATANTGTVTSVGVTVPTGLSVSGTPITSSGTFAISLAAGYSIPTTSSQTNWDTAYTDRNKWDGGATGLTAATGRTSLGGTTVGQNVFTLTNPSAVTFPRFNADNTVSALDAATFRTAIGVSSSSGTVTSVSGTGTVSGLSLSGTVTSSGNLTLGGTLAVTPSNFASQTANQVLAAPNGVAGVPTFRALVAADIPTLNQNTTGSSGSCTGNAASASSVPWSGVTSKPTTLAGYGITDAASSTHTHSYAPQTSGSSLLQGNGSGGFTNVSVGSGLSLAAGVLSASSAASGLTYIGTVTGAASVATFTGLSDGYYFIIGHRPANIAGVSSTITIQFGFGSPVTYVTSGYTYYYQYLNGAYYMANASDPSSYIGVNSNDAFYNGAVFSAYLCKEPSGSIALSYQLGGSSTPNVGGGRLQTTQNLTAVKLAGAQVTSAVFRLYKFG